MALTPDELRQITTDLLTLTGWSIGDLARVAELHRPNLVSWLGSKPQVMSEYKQLKACETLGWHYGRLRRDVVHRWMVGNDFELCRAMLMRYGIRTSDDLEVRPAYGSGSGVFGGAVLISRDDLQNPLIILVKRLLGRESLMPIGAETLKLGVFNECPFDVTAAANRDWWQAEPAPDRQYPAKLFLQGCAEQWQPGMSSLGDQQLVLLTHGQVEKLRQIEKEKYFSSAESR